MSEPHPLSQFRFCPKCGSAEFREHNAKSKRCDACGFVYYFNPSAATVAIIRNERDELLVCRRAKEPAKGTLDLSGGFIDCHETAEEGVAREVMEETGLEVTHTQYLFSLPNIYPYSGFEVHTEDLFFLCTVRDAGHLEAMDDVAAARWMRPEDIRPEEFGLGSVRKGIERFLKEYLNK
jgi:mutator protein MutT